MFLFLLYVGDDNPCKVINDAVTKYKNFTAKWNGITGSDHLPRYVLSFSQNILFYFQTCEFAVASLSLKVHFDRVSGTQNQSNQNS